MWWFKKKGIGHSCKGKSNCKSDFCHHGKCAGRLPGWGCRKDAQCASNKCNIKSWNAKTCTKMQHGQKCSKDGDCFGTCFHDKFDARTPMKCCERGVRYTLKSFVV